MAKALIIDDDPFIANLIAGAEALAGSPAMVDEVPLEFAFAANDAEALQILSEMHDIDIALVSVESSVISGMDLFKQMKGVQLRVPRIAITDTGHLDVVRGAMTDGAADFLVKPLDYEDLIATVSRVYARTERRRNAWKTEAQLAALRKELDIAGNIQQSILPSLFPDREDYGLAAEVRPARDMSGDFYDFFELDNGHLFLVMADVAGKGIPAAFYMAVARTLIRAIALSGGGPKDCLAQVNTALCRHDISGMFVSVFVAEINPDSWTMTYANGGHLPPVIRRASTGQADFLLEGGDGVVLGVQEPLDYFEGHCQLDEGDCVLFYTDGVTEAFNPDREQFSPDRLAAYMQGLTQDAQVREVIDGLYVSIADFVGDAPQSDDITALAFHRRCIQP